MNDMGKGKKSISLKLVNEIVARVKRKYGINAYKKVKQAMVEVKRVKGKKGPKMYRQVSESLSRSKWSGVKAHNRKIREARKKLVRHGVVGGAGASVSVGAGGGYLAGKEKGKEVERLRYSMRSGDMAKKASTINKRANDISVKLEKVSILNDINKMIEQVDKALVKELNRKDIRRYQAAGLLDMVAGLSAAKVTRKDILSKRNTSRRKKG